MSDELTRDLEDEIANLTERHQKLRHIYALLLHDHETLLEEASDLQDQIKKLNFELMDYQVKGPYEKGHEHGVLTGMNEITYLRERLLAAESGIKNYDGDIT